MSSDSKAVDEPTKMLQKGDDSKAKGGAVDAAAEQSENLKNSADASVSTTKRSSPENSNESTTAKESVKRPRSEVLDLANVFGLKAGDRLEVEWQIGDDDAGDQSESHWWGATLQEHDGRVEDGVAIRVLDYDAYPEKGFPDRSQEDVIFLQPDMLVNLKDHSEMHYRREGDDDDAILVGRQDVEATVNSIIDNAVQKNSRLWNNMTPAQQAFVAGHVAAKKEKLVELLEDHLDNVSGVVTQTDVQSILAKAMAD